MEICIVTKPCSLSEAPFQDVTIESADKKMIAEEDIEKGYHTFVLRYVKGVSMHNHSISDGHHLEILFGDGATFRMNPCNLMGLYFGEGSEKYIEMKKNESKTMIF